MRFFQKIVLALCLYGFYENKAFALAGRNGPQIGEVPPPLVLSESIQGPSTTEISWDKLKGKVVVVEFWNTQCAPCIEAIPHLNELAEQFSNRVVFISISDDNGDHLRRFLKRRPIKSWVVLDGLLNPTRVAFDVHGIPHTVIVDASGKIAAITHPTLLKSFHLEEILAGKPCSLQPPQVYSPDDKSTVAVTNPAPTKVEISTKGPLPKPEPKTAEVKITGPFPMPERGPWGMRHWDSATVFTAEKAELADVLASFFDISPKLIVCQIKLPEGLYDVSASAPPGQPVELKRRFGEALQANFNITAQTNRKIVGVYTLTVCSNAAPGLKPAQRGGGGGERPGGFYFTGVKIKTVAEYLEMVLDKPVVNETRLSGLWAVDLKWKMSEAEEVSGARPDPAQIIQAARDQLGLDLEPGRRQMTILELRSEN